MRYLKAICLAMIIILAIAPLGAAQLLDANPVELVILFDLSHSMNANDPDKLTADSVLQLAHALPSNYQVGLLGFNGEILERVALTGERSRITAALAEIDYQGYTNTGLALQQALTMFSADCPNRLLVLFCDGEISMPNQAGTAEAEARFAAALAEAVAMGIPIYTFGIGSDFNRYDNSIKDAAAQTGGQRYEVLSTQELSGLVQRFLIEELEIRRSMLGTATNSGENKLQLQLPVDGLEVARILLLASGPISDITATCNSAKIEIVQGNRFAAVTIHEPLGDEVTIRYLSEGPNEVKAELIGEYQATLCYLAIPHEPESRRATSYQTEIALWLENSSGRNLFDQPYFEGNFIDVRVGGTNHTALITDGLAVVAYDVSEEHQATVSVNLAPYDLLFFGAAPVDVAFEALPDPGPNYWLWGSVGLAVLVAAVIVLCLYRAKVRRKPRPVPVFESRYPFGGKINIYVTKTPTEIDIPPQTFDLYRQSKAKEISLQMVLQQCRLASPFPGAERIYFVPGKDQALNVVNDSECTILIGGDILLKKRERPLYYGEKVHITFEDELTELEVHYKSVKPSEMKYAG